MSCDTPNADDVPFVYIFFHQLLISKLEKKNLNAAEKELIVKVIDVVMLLKVVLSQY